METELRLSVLQKQLDAKECLMSKQEQDDLTKCAIKSKERVMSLQETLEMEKSASESLAKEFAAKVKVLALSCCVR